MHDVDSLFWRPLIFSLNPLTKQFYDFIADCWQLCIHCVGKKLHREGIAGMMTLRNLLSDSHSRVRIWEIQSTPLPWPLILNYLSELLLILKIYMSVYRLLFPSRAKTAIQLPNFEPGKLQGGSRCNALWWALPCGLEFLTSILEENTDSICKLLTKMLLSHLTLSNLFPIVF